MILAVLTPIAQHPNRACILGVAGGHCAAFAVRSQILARIETEARHIADAAHRTPFIFRSVGLRRVFDHNQPMPARHVHNRVHVGRLAVEMHGQDRLRARRDRGLNRGRIHRESAGINIHQNGARSAVGDGGNAGDKSERHGDDFIARTDSGRKQREMQSTSP